MMPRDPLPRVIRIWIFNWSIPISLHRLIEICEESIFAIQEYKRLQGGKQKSHRAKSYGFSLHSKNSLKWIPVASLAGVRMVFW